MNIGKYTTLASACKSDMAIRHGIENKPDELQLNNMMYLASHIYDPLCDHFKRAIPFSSWFRSSQINSLIRGVRKSQHVEGLAVDLDMDLNPSESITNSVIFHFILNNLDFDQLIWEYGNDQNPAWVHVSATPSNPRKQVLRIKSRADGYEPFMP